MPSQISDPNKERKYRRPTCSAGVPTTLTHRSSDLADDSGESQFGAVAGRGCNLVCLSIKPHCHHATGQEVTVSLCDGIPTSSHQCHLHGSLVSYITLLPPYSHCVSMPPYHSITMSHSPCISVATSHCHHVTCHHCLSRVLPLLLRTKLGKVSSTPSDPSQTPIRRRMSPNLGTGQVFTLATGALGLLL